MSNNPFPPPPPPPRRRGHQHAAHGPRARALPLRPDLPLAHRLPIGGPLNLRRLFVPPRRIPNFIQRFENCAPLSNHQPKRGTSFQPPPPPDGAGPTWDGPNSQGPGKRFCGGVSVPFIPSGSSPSRSPPSASPRPRLVFASGASGAAAMLTAVLADYVVPADKAKAAGLMGLPAPPGRRVFRPLASAGRYECYPNANNASDLHALSSTHTPTHKYTPAPATLPPQAPLGW